MGRLTVLFFAGARDIVGAESIRLPVGAAATVREVMGTIYDMYPALAAYDRALRVAVNGTYARADDPVSDGDEIAVIPPVAGG